ALLVVFLVLVLAAGVRSRSVVVARFVVVGAAGILPFAVVLAREIACRGRLGRGRRIGEVTPEIVGPRALGEDLVILLGAGARRQLGEREGGADVEPGGA